MYSQSKPCVRLNNTLTDFFGNYVGVKQGDNLSPNLFKIFINDLPDYDEYYRPHLKWSVPNESLI
jgi:hypothetical protein